MLLRFSVENHGSIRERQELVLVPSKLSDPEGGLINCPAAEQGKLLPAIVIYGANASGKTQLISALDLMRSHVLLSYAHGSPDSGTVRNPFALDDDFKHRPTQFNIDFIMGNIRYQYGFELTDDEFVSEWLFSFPKNRQKVLFERSKIGFYFNRDLKGRNKIISDLTRPNSLFLSTAAQNNHKFLMEISTYFRSIRIDKSIATSVADVSMKLQDAKTDERVVTFLRSIGTGVVDFRQEEKDLSEVDQEISNAFITAFSKLTIAKSAELKVPDKQHTISLAHTSCSGEKVFFDLENESAGTRRLLMLLGRIFRSIDEGTLFVLDEIDASLHTQVCEGILALFSMPEINTKGAQLIATTHDTNLLQSQFLRRDQVWFTEKNKEGATELFPLTDIRSRKGDNIEKGYLQGRFGAIPGPVRFKELLRAN